MRCLRNLERKGFAAVDDTRANTIEVCEIVAREEDALCVTAQVGGRAHPVEKQSVFSFGRARVIYVTARHRYEGTESSGDPFPQRAGGTTLGARNKLRVVTAGSSLVFLNH